MNLLFIHTKIADKSIVEIRIFEYKGEQSMKNNKNRMLVILASIILCLYSVYKIFNSLFYIFKPFRIKMTFGEITEYLLYYSTLASTPRKPLLRQITRHFQNMHQIRIFLPLSSNFIFC